MKYAQIVVGPAGSGKSTYCSSLVKHGEAIKRRIDVVNLDPAAEEFTYNPIVDVRELIDINDVMEELDYGPNGGLVYCMEYLIENKDWLVEKLGEQDDDYILFDVPGQIELFTHFNIISKLCQMLLDLDFRVCGVYCLDSQFVTDISKFISGTFTALSTLVNLEIPFVNVLTKIDLLDKTQRRSIERFLEPNSDFLEEDLYLNSSWGSKYKKLSKAIGSLLEDYSLVRFLPLSVNKETLMEDVLLSVDSCLQYGEHEDVVCKDFEEPEPNAQNDQIM